MKSRDISLMIGKVKFNFRVGIIIEYDGKVLIERNPKIDYGVIPGGRVKTLEDVKSALIRELEEEMHIKFNRRELVLQNFIENFYVFNDFFLINFDVVFGFSHHFLVFVVTCFYDYFHLYLLLLYMNIIFFLKY